MNIEKLAKHLKEFTFEEIEMIAECDCKTELERLLNANKIVFEYGVYKFKGKGGLTFDIFATQKNQNDDFDYKFSSAVKYFLENYVQKHCKNSTFKRYQRQFKFDITPYFENMTINNIELEDICKFYQKCVELEFKPLKIKNTLALLKQFIKYFQEQGLIETKCIFQVRRITSRNEFNMSRLVFKENL